MKRTINQQSQNSRHLLSWLNSTLQTQEVQVENLGNGVAYCLIMHHYFPSLINLKKLSIVPRRQSDNHNNLRLLSQALISLKWTYIGFDISKVANYSYLDNLQLLNNLYHSITKSGSLPPRIHFEQVHTKSLSSSKPTQNHSMLTTVSGSTPKPIPQLGSKSASTEQKYHPNPNSLNNTCSTTPLKNNHKLQPNVVESIKLIIKGGGKSDREKVKQLKHLLGIQIEEKVNFEEEIDKDLLAEYNKKEPTIIIDQS